MQNSLLLSFFKLNKVTIFTHKVFSFINVFLKEIPHMILVNRAERISVAERSGASITEYK